MNARTRIDPVTMNAMTATDEIDNSLYVLVSSTLATVVSLAGVWMLTAISYAPVIGL